MRKTYLVIMAVLAVTLWAAAAQANLITNGGFETPNIGTGAGYYPIGTGGNSVPSNFGWTVSLNNVDIINGYQGWVAEEGTQCLDLAGYAPGEISQTFNTTFGTKYTLTFWYTNNANAGSASATVTVTGTGTLLSDTVSQSGAKNDSLGWTSYTTTFTANSAQTTLDFKDLGNSASGMLLDAVSVNAVPLPPSVLLLGSGLAGLGLLRRKWGVKA